MAGDETFNIGPQAKDIDLYIGGIVASAYINSLAVTVSASAITIAIGTSASTIQSTSTISGSKIAFASSSIDIATTVNAVPKEILKSLIHSDTVTTVAASAMKVASASSSIAIVSSLTIAGTRITKALITSAIVSTAQAAGIRVAKASSVINITHVVNFTAKEIILANISISIRSRSNINSPVRFSPSFIDYSSIRTFLILDDKPLTNHNREFDISISPSFIENRNWNNRKSRYYKRASESGRKTFSLSWKFLPNFMTQTVDTRHGRDYIASISEDPDVHILKVINQDQNGLTPYTETSYNVFVRSYSETLLRRDLSNGVYYFDCNLTLEEA
jgi:hypothetical protein